LQTEVEMQRRRVMQLHDKSRQAGHIPLSRYCLPSLDPAWIGCMAEPAGTVRRARPRRTLEVRPGGLPAWLSRWRDDPSAERRTLIFRNDEDDPEFDEVRRAAAADVAAVEQDDKFFGRNAPANQDEGL